MVFGGLVFKKQERYCDGMCVRVGLEVSKKSKSLKLSYMATDLGV